MLRRQFDTALAQEKINIIKRRHDALVAANLGLRAKLDSAKERNVLIEARWRDAVSREEEVTLKIGAMQRNLDVQREVIQVLRGAGGDFSPATERLLNELLVTHQRDATAALVRINRRVDQSLAQNEKLKSRIRLLVKQMESLQSLTPISRVWDFAQNAAAILPKDCDCIVAHGMQPLPVKAFKSGPEVKYVNDCIEIPSFSDRILPVSWTDVTLDILNRTLESYLQECNHVLTVSKGLASHLKNIGCSNISVIENFRDYQTVPSKTDFRKKLSLADSDVLLLSVSTITAGAIDVIDALRSFDRRFHLAFVGRFAPVGYKEEVSAFVDSVGLSNRVHFLEEVPYSELSSVCRGADLGLIIRDPSIRNNYISLPNRVFDYISGGLPFLAPLIPDINQIQKDFNCGLPVETIDRAGWAEGIQNAVEMLPSLKCGAVEANNQLKWEAHFETFKTVFENLSHICFVAVGDITKNNRTYRLAQWLISNNKSVTLVSGGNADQRRFLELGASVRSVTEFVKQNVFHEGGFEIEE